MPLTPYLKRNLGEFGWEVLEDRPRPCSDEDIIRRLNELVPVDLPGNGPNSVYADDVLKWARPRLTDGIFGLSQYELSWMIARRHRSLIPDTIMELLLSRNVLLVTDTTVVHPEHGNHALYVVLDGSEVYFDTLAVHLARRSVQLLLPQSVASPIG